MKLRRIFAWLLAVCVFLSGCGDHISEFPSASGDAALTSPDISSDADNADPLGPPDGSLGEAIAQNGGENGKESLGESGEPYSVGEFYGSYLTMFKGNTPGEERGLPFFKIFRSYSDVERYYDETVSGHIYARQFTTTLASFSDEFFRENEVLILVIDEPSSYINHTAGPITVYPDRLSFDITRHQPEASPLLNTEYHLIFTAPAGSFDGVDGREIELNISEQIDEENNSAFDADMFRIFHPEFTSFTYRTDPLREGAARVVDAIEGYDALVYFYDNYKEAFDLDAEFKDKIGTLYNWNICERYVLFALLLPVSDGEPPEISDLFVNNLEIYITLTANEPEPDDEPNGAYLLLCGIERRDLMGVDLGVINLSVTRRED